MASDDRTRWIRLLAGFVLFEAAWFACVLGAAHGRPVPGIAAVIVVVFLLLAMSRRRGADLLLIALALGVGLSWDSLMVRTGVVAYASPGPLPAWAPAWILALWALFAPMLREPLRWLHGRPALAAAVGGVGGALSYAGAARLGACAFPDAPRALTALGVGWAVITPALLAVARRLDRDQPILRSSPFEVHS